MRFETALNVLSSPLVWIGVGGLGILAGIVLLLFRYARIEEAGPPG
jgi:hypothetical protein